MMQANAPIPLASRLGLKPLDRVMVYSAHEIREARAFSRYADRPVELPWFYFQRVVGEQIEVRSPGGYACEISPLDVCDVIPGVPIQVRAMPLAKFIERSALPLSQRQNPADASFYAEANVLCAEKGTFGRIDFMVWFADDSLNGPRPTRGVFEPGVGALLASRARRSTMPVSHRSTANHSADHGVSKAVAVNRHVVSNFIRSRLTSMTGSSALLNHGATPLTKAAINRLA
jgi:hypothetical protein